MRAYLQDDIDRTEEDDKTVDSSLPESFFGLIDIVEDRPVDNPKNISD